jgi:hypothetical protein
MAAAKSTTTSRDELKAQLRADILAALNTPKKVSGVSVTDRVLNWSADKLADSGNGVAELAAGAAAAVDNFGVTYASAQLRQKARTRDKIDALVERRLALEGL